MLRTRHITTAAATLFAATASTIGFGTGAASAALSPGAIGMGWSIPNVPAAGLSNITFPMEIDPQTLHKDGTYFAQQFGFTNLASGAYMGLQPRPDLNGHERLHAAFSSFIKGTTNSDPYAATAQTAATASAAWWSSTASTATPTTSPSHVLAPTPGAAPPSTP